MGDQAWYFLNYLGDGWRWIYLDSEAVAEQSKPPGERQYPSYLFWQAGLGPGWNDPAYDPATLNWAPQAWLDEHPDWEPMWDEDRGAWIWYPR